MRTQLSHRRPSGLERFWFGAAYYPEHWDAATRARDAERMATAGFNLVRMGEFAWSAIEPEPGRYDFALFDETIERLGRQGIATMLGTPTAAPPRWLTRAQPEVLRVRADGVAMCHGSRQQACHASTAFREHSRRITRAMAEHYRDNPWVVAWQTDNEFHCHFSECHCESCQRGFREFLAAKFADDIGALNAAWGTRFWSLTYRSFEEIETPRPGRPTVVNPAAQLDYYRYLSAAVTRFQAEQVAILREVNPRWWITHNGLFGHIDYRGDFTRDLDVLGYDCYPQFCREPVARPAWLAWHLDRARAWAGNFVIPEMQSGPGGQASYFHEPPVPGALRAMTYAAIGRGADSLLYFRWRTCRFGAEQYWCGILDHDDVPRRRYTEVCQVGRELSGLGPKLRGTSVHVEVGIAGADWLATETHRTYPMGLPEPEEVAAELHRWHYERGHAVGVVHPADELRGIRLYVIPHWVVFDPAWVPALERYVRDGGVLVIGARTATRDAQNNVIAETIPGCLRDLTGVTVQEYGRQNVPTHRLRLGGRTVATAHWYEMLNLGKGTMALGHWTTGHLAGQAAVSWRRLGGRGGVAYVGTYLVPALLPVFVRLAKVKRQWPVPASVEVVQRVGVGRRLWFFINHGPRKVGLDRLPAGRVILGGLGSGKRVRLGPQEVVVLESRLSVNRGL